MKKENVLSVFSLSAFILMLIALILLILGIMGKISFVFAIVSFAIAIILRGIKEGIEAEDEVKKEDKHKKLKIPTLEEESKCL